MRVPGPEGRWAPKQLTLCYTDTAGEAAVGRYLATLWSWHQVVVAGGGAPQLPRSTSRLPGGRGAWWLHVAVEPEAAADLCMQPLLESPAGSPAGVNPCSKHVACLR